MSLQFNENYLESVTLADGTLVRLRLLRPDDKQLLLEAWERLLPNSRYRRFLSSKERLSKLELAYLTELDGVNHFALGAERADRSQGLGVARFIRLKERPHVAEAAVAVTDDAQGKGLGRALLSRLMAAARERGIDRFACEVLASNEPMLSLLRSVYGDLPNRVEEGTFSLEIPLGEEAGPAAAQTPKLQPPLYRLLSAVANGRLGLKRSAFVPPAD